VLRPYMTEVGGLVRAWRRRWDPLPPFRRSGWQRTPTRRQRTEM